MKRQLALLLGGVLVFVGVSMLLVDVIPPRSLTATRMTVTKRRVLEYASARNALPPSLSDLPPSPGHDDAVIDAWHRPILYAVDPTGVVTLTSLGQDGKPGDSGDDADIICSFSIPKARSNVVRRTHRLAETGHDSAKPTADKLSPLTLRSHSSLFEVTVSSPFRCSDPLDQPQAALRTEFPIRTTILLFFAG